MDSLRKVKVPLIIVGLFMAAVFFLGENIMSGDFEGSILWQPTVFRTHLLNDFTLPYITPTRCGGWLLLADAQSIIFSIYTIFCYIIPNNVWACKIVNFLISIFFSLGLCIWFKRIGIVDKNTWLFSSLLVIFSGSWLYHMSTGGIWMHGLAYMPWIMIIIEKLLVIKPCLERHYVALLLLLTALFFLLINSGYMWMQAFIPIIAYRFIVELIFSKKDVFRQSQRLGIIILTGLFAILLSLSRLGGVYEFQATKFPRGGDGIAPHYQVIGHTIYLLEMLFRSFFDSSIVVHRQSHFSLGSMNDYTNFIGIAAIIPLLLGLFEIKKLLRNKIFLTILLASIGHLLVLRTTHVGDLVRMIMPFFKSITWHWRGNMVLVLLVCIFIACGYTMIFRSKWKYVRYLGIALMFINLGEIVYANRNFITFPDPPITALLQEFPVPPPKPLQTHYTWCMLGCIFGYGHEFPEQLSISSNMGGGGTILDNANPEFFNMHDVRKLFGPEANGGYYVTHKWPLWPKKDLAEFEKFINYKQVVPFPPRLKVMIFICVIAWIIYLLCIGFYCALVLRRRVQPLPSVPS